MIKPSQVFLGGLGVLAVQYLPAATGKSTPTDILYFGFQLYPKATYHIPQSEPFPLSGEIEAIRLRAFLNRYRA